jgi:antitoxin (DNA-binding transcriptional repressor) of toxin-antitoxin stability system
MVGLPNGARAMQVNVYDAKSQLPALLDKASAGATIIIARAGKPMARLVPLASPPAGGNGVRFGGLKPSRLGLAPDLHAPISDEDLIGQ